MKNIVQINEAITISKNIRREGKTIVLIGGCFDILHVGHIEFLKSAKEQGDFLIVLLENDTNIGMKKGDQRPINTQADRARILSVISYVDLVVLLPSPILDEMYDTIVSAIKPAIIATTKGDPGRFHKERQAISIGARVVDVTDRVPHVATSLLAKLIQKEFSE